MTAPATATTAPDLAVLDAPAAWAWLTRELLAAAGSARHGFHLLVAATVGHDGSPDARTVVLRHVDPVRREVGFHTDVRSPKVVAIARDARVALHWYDATVRVQVRAAATAVIHHGDAVAAAAWAAAKPMSRACYAAPVPPGTPLAGFPAALAPGTADAGRESFAVVTCRFDDLEILALHAAGHQRVVLHVATDPVTWTVLAP